MNCIKKSLKLTSERKTSYSSKTIRKKINELTKMRIITLRRKNNSFKFIFEKTDIFAFTTCDIYKKVLNTLLKFQIHIDHFQCYENKHRNTARRTFITKKKKIAFMIR